MRVLRFLMLLSFAVLSAVMCSNPQPSYFVPQEEMVYVYEQVNTPVKHGIVVFPEDTTLYADSPGVFRHDGKWYMTWIAFDGKGYETWLSESGDLLHWTNLGKILSYRDGWWDCWQRAGYPALQDMEWGGSYELEQYDGKYWMSYLAGDTSGYEAGVLTVGMACSDSLNAVREWETFDAPVLSPRDEECQWFERETQYKSHIIHDRNLLTGHEFVMYYNARGVNPADSIKAERIGMAFSDDMRTWTRYEGNPVLGHGDSRITGDPQIQKIGDLYVMFYFRAFTREKPYLAYNCFACSRDLIHWYDWEGEDLIYPTEDYDCVYAHKSWVVRWDGVTYHFYCACDDRNHRGIAVATSLDK